MRRTRNFDLNQPPQEDEEDHRRGAPRRRLNNDGPNAHGPNPSPNLNFPYSPPPPPQSPLDAYRYEGVGIIWNSSQRIQDLIPYSFRYNHPMGRWIYPSPDQIQELQSRQLGRGGLRFRAINSSSSSSVRPPRQRPPQLEWFPQPQLGPGGSRFIPLEWFSRQPQLVGGVSRSQQARGRGGPTSSLSQPPTPYYCEELLMNGWPPSYYHDYDVYNYYPRQLNFDSDTDIELYNNPPVPSASLVATTAGMRWRPSPVRAALEQRLRPISLDVYRMRGIRQRFGPSQSLHIPLSPPSHQNMRRAPALPPPGFHQLITQPSPPSPAPSSPPPFVYDDRRRS